MMMSCPQVAQVGSIPESVALPCAILAQRHACEFCRWQSKPELQEDWYQQYQSGCAMSASTGRTACVDTVLERPPV